MSLSGNSAQVVVVIVNWGKPGDTIQCIRSVMDSEFSDIQIVVIDNGSNDDSVDK